MLEEVQRLMFTKFPLALNSQSLELVSNAEVWVRMLRTLLKCENTTSDDYELVKILVILCCGPGYEVIPHMLHVE